MHTCIYIVGIYIYVYWVHAYLEEELHMGFQRVAFLPSQGSSHTIFFKVVVEVMVLRLPDVLNLWLGVIK